MEKIKTYGFARWFRLIISTILKRLYFVPIAKSFSQYGEDVIIDHLLGNKRSGFYVDVGAFDPDLISNTRRFYEKGWRGINIEPNPEKYKKFIERRPKDTNLNMGVSDKKAKLTAYKFIGAASFTFAGPGGHEVETKNEINVDTLANILKDNANSKKIDFMSVDTEGLDLNVLKGNDWQTYRPEIICVETYNPDDFAYEKRISEYMLSVSYRKVHDNGLNSFYKDLKL